MLIAAVGHVDHGKTTLIRALTGVDTDRLPEEKRRRLSIEIGFAYQPSANGRVLGFIDVPGHERFVHNMLAGMPTIDLALLVVAADDGPMPQTLEHLAILDLLGIRQAIVVITKCDRVDQRQLRSVRDVIAALLSDTALAEAPVIAIGAPEGEGIDALRSALHDRAAALLPKVDDQGFRLAIDRCFTIRGAGLVVTGAVFAGRVQVGDRLLLAPIDLPVRVRSIHAQGRSSLIGRIGERCALNIVGAGVDGERVRRGHWLIERSDAVISDRIDIQLTVLRSEPRPLQHWTPVHVHHGAADLSGRIALLADHALVAGASGFAQLVLNEAIPVAWGDRMVLRDQSARRTIAGGLVVDPLALRRGRARPERFEVLNALLTPEPITALKQALIHTPAAFDLEGFLRARNNSPETEQRLRAEALVTAKVLPPGALIVAKTRWNQLCARIDTLLWEWHRHHPDEIGLDSSGLRAGFERGLRPLVDAALREMLARRRIIKEGRRYRQAAHQPRLPTAEAAIWERLGSRPEFRTRQPPSVPDLALLLNHDPEKLRTALQRLAFRGYLVRVSNRYLLPETMAALADIAVELGTDDRCFDAKSYRNRANIGRNFAIELLEYFDFRGLTRRIGDQRILVGSCAKLFA